MSTSFGRRKLAALRAFVRDRSPLQPLPLFHMADLTLTTMAMM
jgi:hypothetical protein